MKNNIIEKMNKFKKGDVVIIRQKPDKKIYWGDVWVDDINCMLNKPLTIREIISPNRFLIEEEKNYSYPLFLAEPFKKRKIG